MNSCPETKKKAHNQSEWREFSFLSGIYRFSHHTNDDDCYHNYCPKLYHQREMGKTWLIQFSFRLHDDISVDIMMGKIGKNSPV